MLPCFRFIICHAAEFDVIIVGIHLASTHLATQIQTQLIRPTKNGYSYNFVNRQTDQQSKVWRVQHGSTHNHLDFGGAPHCDQDPVFSKYFHVFVKSGTALLNYYSLDLSTTMSMVCHDEPKFATVLQFNTKKQNKHLSTKLCSAMAK